MKVYALVGKSGTGKSYQATNLCKEKRIDSLIDDGLFIMGSIMAGTSAKRETTKIGAIKTALFSKEEHRNTVKEAIADANPSSIIILGTSTEMVDRIASTLGLPEISEYINIEDITTQSEREMAEIQRQELGKHVIPVPTFRLKRQFSGYFIDPLRIFKGKGKANESESESEKSVVRPTYSYLGDYAISEKVIADIAAIVAGNDGDIKQISRVTADKRDEEVKISAVLTLRYGCKVMQVAKAFQQELEKEVAKMTAFNVSDISIEVKDLEF